MEKIVNGGRVNIQRGQRGCVCVVKEMRERERGREYTGGAEKISSKSYERFNSKRRQQ